MVGTMGLLGLTLALIGLYGLVAYSVARRTREIGLRMAIGADQVGRAEDGPASGIDALDGGHPGGRRGQRGVARLLAAGMVGLGASEPGDLCRSSRLLLISLTMAASYVPARRAATIDPLVALRDD